MRRMSWICGIVLAVAALGCESEPGLRVVIDSEGMIPDVNIDSLTVDVIASQEVPSRNDDGELIAFTCRASEQRWEGDELSFPLEITVRPGDVAWECVGLRARGYFDENLVIRAEATYCLDLEGGVTDERLTLDSRCRITAEREACAADEVCREGQCETSSVGELFELTPVTLEACDRGSD